MLLSINQLSELTRRDRRTITKHLQDLRFVDGPKGALLYESSEALPLIYRVDNLEQAKAKHALSQASLNAVREEELRKERIPIQLVLDEWDSIFQEIAAILKNCKALGAAQVNEIFEKMRNVPKRLKW
jgi:hypothetical protein